MDMSDLNLFYLNYWTYDDGSIAVEFIKEPLILETGETKKKYTLLENITAYETYCEKLCKRKDMRGFDKKDDETKGKILCGIKYVRQPSYIVKPEVFPQIINSFWGKAMKPSPRSFPSSVLCWPRTFPGYSERSCLEKTTSRI